MKDSKLKIFAIPAWYPSNNDKFAGIFVREHLIALAPSCEIIVLYISGTKNQDRAIKRQLNSKDGLTELFFYFKLFNFKIRFLEKIYKLTCYLTITLFAYIYIFIKFGTPSLIHVHVLTRVAVIPYFLKVFLGIPYIVTDHYTRYLPEDGSYPHNYFHHRLTKSIVAKANALTTVSKHLLQSMNNFGLISRRQYVIPNVLNSVFFEKNILPKANDSKKLNLIHVSTLNQNQKNIKGIIDALVKVKKTGRDFCFNIYGGYEPYLSQCRVYALQFSDLEIVFHEVVAKAEIANAIAEADVSIVFSNYETQGCVVFESLAVGTPVIASDLPAIAEILNPRLGVLVERKNVSSLATAILNFDPDEFEPRYLKDYALKKYGPSTIKDQFLKVYLQSIKANV